MKKYEQKLVEKFKKIEAEYDRLMRECDEYFLPLAKEYIKQGYIKGAKEIMARCPCHVTNVFIADAIRVSQGLYDKFYDKNGKNIK